MARFHQEIPNSVKTAFFTVLFIFVFLYIFSSLFGPIPFAVNSVTTNKTDMFTVNGEGEASAVPDTALINFGVTKTANTVELAKTQMNDTVEMIISELKSLGIDEKHIKTTNFSINPTYDYTSSRQTITGYTANQNVEVRVKPLEKANQAIDKATSAGANNVGGVSFVLDDEKKTELEQKARVEAIKKAKEKATAIASAAGIRLGKLINIQEGSFNPPVPMAAELKTVGRDAGTTDLQPGENSVKIQVTLSYETY